MALIVWENLGKHLTIIHFKSALSNNEKFWIYVVKVKNFLWKSSCDGVTQIGILNLKQYFLNDVFESYNDLFQVSWFVRNL